MIAHPQPEPGPDEHCQCVRAALPAAQFGEDDPPLGIEALHSVPPELFADGAA
ncbi:MAG: hypothetical protein M9907_07195 [Burkholderiaceae bacterium]|nr:hypothetical protein [Burkholderiaceae bacterium]